MRVEHIRISGMDNRGCANAIARALKDMGGVRSVQVSSVSSEAKVEYDERITNPSVLRLAIMGAGYEIEGATAA